MMYSINIKIIYARAIALLRVDTRRLRLLAYCKKERIMEFIKKNLLAVIVAGAAVLALILGLIFPGVVAEMNGGKFTIGILGMAFGGAEYKVSAGGTTMTAKIGDGGMSIFGLISLIALLVGLVLVVVSMLKGQEASFIGSALIAFAGVCMLLLLVAGTDVSQTVAGTTRTTKFTTMFEEFKLGFGAIIYAIIAIIGGGLGVLNKFKKII